MSETRNEACELTEKRIADFHEHRTCLGSATSKEIYQAAQMDMLIEQLSLIAQELHYLTSRLS
ncbi:MAG: hypothetical protein LIP12_00795 [Clostridiales bacterium]|nr:hypothetical protein [Clostridiales bacterium]